MFTPKIGQILSDLYGTHTGGQNMNAERYPPHRDTRCPGHTEQFLDAQ